MILGLGLSAVQGCPCQELHLLDTRMRLVHDLIMASGTGPLPIVSDVGTWWVPRVFVACHGVELAVDLPVLAERYGWLRA